MDGGTGRCLCGQVRYAFVGVPNWQAICDCESCRRATSAPMVAWLGVTHGKWRWTGTAPQAYPSSPGVTRYFCPTCGSPMGYQGEEWAHEMHFLAASLDDPEAYRPTAHVNWNEHLSWVTPGDGLRLFYTPRRLTGAEEMGPILNLVRAAFAYMDGVVDPPSSVHALTEADIARQAREGEVWVIEELGRPLACLFLTAKADHLYIGKLAVADSHRRRGLARQLLKHAGARAKALGLPQLQMQSRVELTGNHAAFQAMGFARAGETAHPGFDRPTSVTFVKEL